MRTTTWIILGLAFNGGAALLHGPDTPIAADLAQTIPSYLPSVVLAAAGQYCLYRALRRAIADAWRGLWGGNHRSAGAAPAARSVPAPEPASGFDADEAFARYLEQRKEAEADSVEPQAPPPSPAAPVRARGGFGRKVIQPHPRA
jgi:hypothetical protein